jgi:hypothetical protein
MKADLNHVKNQTAFNPNTTPSMAEKGFDAIKNLQNRDEIFSPVDGAPSVLNQEQQGELKKFTKENEVVKYLTPRFEEIFAEANANLAVVNSEKCGWIDTGGGKKNLQQPDLLICHEALYTTHPKIKDGTRRFGGLSNWILRDCIAGIMEAKLSFAGNLTSAVGQIVNYSAYLARNCKEREVVKGVLFDKHKFYSAYMLNGSLTRLIECKWTDAGSENFLLESLYPPSSLSAAYTCGRTRLLPWIWVPRSSLQGFQTRTRWNLETIRSQTRS